MCFYYDCRGFIQSLIFYVTVSAFGPKHLEKCDQGCKLWAESTLCQNNTQQRIGSPTNQKPQHQADFPLFPNGSFYLEFSEITGSWLPSALACV